MGSRYIWKAIYKWYIKNEEDYANKYNRGMGMRIIGYER